jgi:hypothetical protein
VGAQLGWKLQLLVRTGHQTQALPAHMRHNAPVERYGVGAQLGWKLQLLVRTGHQTQALPAHMCPEQSLEVLVK